MQKWNPITIFLIIFFFSLDAIYRVPLLLRPELRLTNECRLKELQILKKSFVCRMNRRKSILFFLLLLLLSFFIVCYSYSECGEVRTYATLASARAERGWLCWCVRTEVRMAWWSRPAQSLWNSVRMHVTHEHEISQHTFMYLVRPSDGILQRCLCIYLLLLFISTKWNVFYIYGVV